jgi:hypothetical protein
MGPAGATGAGGAATFSAGFVNPNNLTPFWLSPNGGTNQTTSDPEVGGLMPIDCTMTALYMQLYTFSGTASTDSITVTLYKNRVATAMTVNATNPAAGSYLATPVSDTTHTVPVSMGDTVSYGVTQTNNTPIVRIAVGMRCQ